MAVTPHSARRQVQWTSGINLIVGIWLIFAPFVLGYAALQVAQWNDIILGILIALLAATRVSKPLRQPGISWTIVVLGFWLVIAPFVLGYGAADLAVASTAQANDVTVGLIVIVLGSWSALASRAAVRHEPAHGRPAR